MISNINKKNYKLMPLTLPCLRVHESIVAACLSVCLTHWTNSLLSTASWSPVGKTGSINHFTVIHDIIGIVKWYRCSTTNDGRPLNQHSVNHTQTFVLMLALVVNNEPRRSIFRNGNVTFLSF